MAAAAGKAAAAATFADIRQSWLRLARQWAALAAQEDVFLRLAPDSALPTCFCGALLAEQEPAGTQLLNHKEHKEHEE
ncbi:MAG TPA: hypothetical protein VMF67_03360 [Rhizomicrobium sp.]|nr:hypothetical protein [Rhizomicrobium sp.]